MRPSSMVPLGLRLYGWRKVNHFKHWLIGPKARAVLVESKNGRLLIDVEDRTIGSPLARLGEYASNEIENLKAHLDAGAEVLVVGAHVGSIVIPLARHCASVIAIEANPSSFQLLELNLKLNDCKNVTAINIAASDKNEMLSFVMSRVNSGGSKRMPLVRAQAYFADSPEITSVPAAPLDQILEGRQPSLVLMDIEGSEYFAARGMQRLLAGAQTLFIEFLPHHLRNVSGVTVSQLLSVLSPHFDRLYVPSKGITVTSDEFEKILQAMYDAEEGDDGIVFTKDLSKRRPAPDSVEA